MVSRASRCRADRIGRLLDDDLTDVERAEMIAHLDDCASCRDRLEATAAEDRWWTDLRKFAPEATVDTPGSAGWQLDDEPVCGFLEPSDEAGVLGKFGPYRWSRSSAGAGWGSCSRRSTRPCTGSWHSRSSPPSSRPARLRAAIRPRGEGGGRGQPRPRRGDPLRRRGEGTALPRHALHPRPVAPGADRP